MKEHHNDAVQSIRRGPGADTVAVLDQRLLPFQIVYRQLETQRDAVAVIRDMVVRGAPLIGVTAAYGMWLAAREDTTDNAVPHLEDAATALKGARPTAVNLAWAVDRQLRVAEGYSVRAEQVAALLHEADVIANEDAGMCRRIGEHGLRIIREIAGQKNGESVHILTHCNAGRLACVEYGTATAPIYLAREEGVDIHVHVDETRPRLQGAKLTAFELGRAGVPHTVAVDGAAGRLMQSGMIDVVLVGCDRLTRNGDVCNKIGTYQVALAARDNDVPFYAALPSSTIDWDAEDWRAIPIEERAHDEVRSVVGQENSTPTAVSILPEASPVFNPAFDVTPARLVTGIITERGVCRATSSALEQLFEQAPV